MLFGFINVFALVFPVMIVIGMAQTIFRASNNTTLLENAPARMRGRIMSIMMMTFGFMPLSAVPFGALAERIGTPDALMISGILLVAFTVLFGIANPRFRRIA